MAGEEETALGNSEARSAGDAVLSAEVVQRVTDEVYRLLLCDLRRERERRGDYGSPAHGRDRTRDLWR
jgi:hypothetical protein